ncbi:kinase-like protein [Lindgomyces ingoldianus]|uniref:Kinase-like protein n=1 Tax=Lindgomyces ingoldianus TaxID=673940 RepID=A0ACB6QTT1_9PLEO|nr:kinase-like protein [Lindgomyces ingoldianus]KAF2470434.1 kinase-like protein [Lindgomyces ingoldianus]
MCRIPDLVKDSKIETQFHSGYTRHIYSEADPTSGQRVIERKEYWKREKLIGRGGFGSVWLEKCVKGKHEAELRAVKQLQKPDKTKEFFRELEAMAKFSHPKYVRCFVRSFGWYDSEDELYIAMEYFPLGDLDSYLRAAPPLPEPDVQQVTFQILEGLHAMHENGFVHRDLKPGNILIHSHPPQEWWVKLADFGISKRTEDHTNSPSTRKGTDGFVPPEWHGFSPNGENISGTSSPAADMWALGEIAFRLFTKGSTFKSSYDLFQFTEGRLPFPLASLEAYKSSLEAMDFVQACMRASPEDRLDAQQAVKHEWMKIEPRGIPRPLSAVSLE